MVTNPAKIGRADAEKVMMYENFNSRGPFSKNGHLFLSIFENRG